MTEQLSDKRLLEITDDDVAAITIAYTDTQAIARELLELRAENAHLRQRCTWLQERRAVLRKLVSSRWSKRREVRRLRAKLAAGPVMPEVPSDDQWNRMAGRLFDGRLCDVYAAIRNALLAEQNGASAVE